MIWEARRYSRNLLFFGFAALNLLIPYPILRAEGIEVGSVLLTLVFAYLLLSSFSYWINPVILRIEEDGLYLRGKYFIPYEKVISCETLPIRNKITIFVDESFKQDHPYIFLRSICSVSSIRVRKSNKVMIGFSWQGAVNHTNTDIYYAVTEALKNKTGARFANSKPVTV